MRALAVTNKSISSSNAQIIYQITVAQNRERKVFTNYNGGFNNFLFGLIVDLCSVIH